MGFWGSDDDDSSHQQRFDDDGWLDEALTTEGSKGTWELWRHTKAGGSREWGEKLLVALVMVAAFEAVLALALPRGTCRRVRWHTLASGVQLVTAWWCFPDVVLTLGDPFGALTVRAICASLPLALSFVLSLVTVVFYFRVISRSHWLFLLGGLLFCYPLLFLLLPSATINGALFFVAGLPSGVAHLLAATYYSSHPPSSPAMGRIEAPTAGQRFWHLLVALPGVVYQLSFAYLQAHFISATISQFSVLRWTAMAFVSLYHLLHVVNFFPRWEDRETAK